MKLRKKLKLLKKNIKIYFLNFFLRKKAEKILSLGKNTNKIGFFTPLPPAQTGTALYALNVYQNIFDDLDFISDIYDLKTYQKTLSFVPEKYHSHIVPLILEQKRTYEHIILNLGNSSFHLPYLIYAIKTKGKEKRHIVLCETQICHMLQTYCNEFNLNFFEMLQKYYPEKFSTNRVNSDFLKSLKEKNIFGIRPLIDLTGINDFIVYRETGKIMLLSDLKGSVFENNVRVSVIPMGVEQIYPQPVPALLEKEGYNIGSFGIAHDMKQTDKIIEAVNLLNHQGKKVTLWLVGYNVSNYVRSFDLTNVRIIEKASFNQLYSIMSAVDLAVQLRKFSNGEGSGCIAELIALNKNFIAAENLFEPYFRQSGVSVPDDCSVTDLAERIWIELNNKTIRNNSSLLETHTFKNTAEKFMEILQ